MPRERKKRVEKLHFDSATLLSVEEVKELLSDEDRAYDEWWWTRTVGTDNHCVADISVYGNIYTKVDALPRLKSWDSLCLPGITTVL